MSEEQVIDFGKKKKKAKKEKGEDATKGDGKYEAFSRGTVWTYEEMLTRLHQTINDLNAGFGLKEKTVIKPPQVVRVGTKRSGWINFQELASSLNREPNHLMNYALAEFGTEGTLAGSGQLLFKGKYTGKNVESLLKKYIKEYVMCSMCRSSNTSLERDQSSRLHTVRCRNCGATRVAANIKSGFHATAKGERRAARQQAGIMQVTA